jgi:hypothetical protein
MALPTLDAMVSPDDTAAAPDAGPAEPPTHEVRFQSSHGFAPILSGLQTSAVGLHLPGRHAKYRGLPLPRAWPAFDLESS